MTYSNKVRTAQSSRDALPKKTCSPEPGGTAHHPPAYVSRSTLATELDCAESHVDELVKRGVLPKPLRLSNAKAITEKCIEMAKAGDIAALRLCMERLVPPRKERVICFEMPPLEKAADCIPVLAAIIRGVAYGELTPGEAAALSKILDSYTRAVELTDLAERIAKL